MNELETLIVSGIVGGTALVPVVDFVTKNIHSEKWTYAVALLSSVVFGLIVTVMQGKITLANLNNPYTVLLSLSTVFITSQTLFKLYWQDSLMREKFNQRSVTTEPVQTAPIAETGQTEIQQ